MVSLFPIGIEINEQQKLNGIFARIRMMRPDWNTSKIIETKHSHEVDYSDYYYNEVLSQASGDVTFAINGDENNGFSLQGDDPNENFTITIIFHSLKIKLKKYVIQKFLQTNQSPQEWILEGCSNKGAWQFIDYQKNKITNESSKDSFFTFDLSNNDKYYSSYQFNINNQHVLYKDKPYLRIKNMEFYGEIDYSNKKYSNFPFSFF